MGACLSAQQVSVPIFAACVPLDGAPMPRLWCLVQDGQDAGTCPRSNMDDGNSKAFVEQHTRGTPSSAVAVDTRNTPGNSPCGDAQLQHTDSTCSSPALETRDASRQLHESSHTATPCTSAQVSGVAAGCSLAHTELRCPEIQNVLDAICQVRCATCNPLPTARRASLGTSLLRSMQLTISFGACAAGVGRTCSSLAAGKPGLRQLGLLFTWRKSAGCTPVSTVLTGWPRQTLQLSSEWKRLGAWHI